VQADLTDRPTPDEKGDGLMESRIRAAADALADPAVYADEDQLHQALTLLRKQAPVRWAEPADYRPFWAITRHADVLEIERADHQFLSAPRTTLMPVALEQQLAAHNRKPRSLIHLDDPDHRLVRAAGAGWFTPQALGVTQARVHELATRYVDRMAELDGICDFAPDIARQFSLYVILSLLGLPESSYQEMFALTQGLLGQGVRGSGPDDYMSAQAGLFSYFQDVADDRMAHPADDLASFIANARASGKRLSRLDITSYYISVATAGYDTVASVISGGLLALIESPDQLDRLRHDPGLMPFAVDEMIRWVTPTRNLMRTAVADYDLRGVTIRAGDAVLLNYLSANRDESVFTAPFSFDVSRNPNRHLAFGYGVHYCLGAALAKIEIGAFFTELLPRLCRIELAGPPVLAAKTFVGGLTSLPVTYELNGWTRTS
jgi:cytochrome P450